MVVARRSQRVSSVLFAFALIALPSPTQAQALTAASWGVGGDAIPDFHIYVDSTVAHTGRASVRIEADHEPEGFASVTTSLPAAPYLGHRVRLSAHFRTASLDGDGAALWLRADGSKAGKSFASTMGKQAIVGTLAWTEIAVELDVPRDALTLVLGAFSAGQGTTWVDDLQIRSVVADKAGVSTPRVLGFELTDAIPTTPRLSVAALAARRASRAAEVAWIEANAIRVRSVDPADTSFADLAPFGKAIGNARIVMLGEQSHGDGTVFLAKTRLIKYLHEKLGFDVLAFESGLYDTKKAWAFVQQGEEPVTAVRRGVFGIWTRSEQVLPLMDYIGAQARTTHPLELSGFDSQLTGSASREFWVSDLLAFLDAHHVALPNEWISAKPVFDSLLANRFYEKKPTAEEQRVLFAVIDSLSAGIAGLSSADRQVAFWKQNLRSVRAHSVWTFAAPQQANTMASGNNGRDLQMGENLIWLARNHFPDKKIIVWAATFHNIRNPEMVGDSILYRGLQNMGHVSWKALGNEIYNLGFVASEGKAGVYRGEPWDIPKPKPGSLDRLFAETSHNFAIVDFRHIPKGGAWLHNRMASAPLGYSALQADWTQVLDGIMYTRVMHPSTKATR